MGRSSDCGPGRTPRRPTDTSRPDCRRVGGGTGWTRAQGDSRGQPRGRAAREAERQNGPACVASGEQPERPGLRSSPREARRKQWQLWEYATGGGYGWRMSEGLIKKIGDAVTDVRDGDTEVDGSARRVQREAERVQGIQLERHRRGRQALRVARRPGQGRTRDAPATWRMEAVVQA